jgi:hypothetical protein
MYAARSHRSSASTASANSTRSRQNKATYGRQPHTRARFSAIASLVVLCVCVCMYAYVRMCGVCMYVSMHVCMYVYVCVCARASVHKMTDLEAARLQLACDRCDGVGRQRRGRHTHPAQCHCDIVPQSAGINGSHCRRPHTHARASASASASATPRARGTTSHAAAIGDVSSGAFACLASLLAGGRGGVVLVQQRLRGSA